MLKEEYIMSLSDLVNAVPTKAVKLLIASTDSNNNTEFEMEVLRETKLSYLTNPLPAYGLIAKSVSEHQSGLIAWDKTRLTRKFGVIDEWFVKEIESVPIVEKPKSRRGRPPKSSQSEVRSVTSQYIAEKKQETGKVLETVEQRAERKARMMEKLTNMRSGV